MKQAHATILIVEDDVLLAMDAADDITSTGADVKTASSVREALHILNTETISAAILDFQVLDGNVSPVAKRLDEIGVPYRIVSGSPKSDVVLAGLNPQFLRSKPASYKKVYLSMNDSIPPTL